MRAACLSLVPLLMAPAAPAQEPVAEGLPLVVHLADGSNLPLRDWTLSYEFVTWPRGESQVLGRAARRDGRELWVGGRRIPASALVMEIEHAVLQRGSESGETAAVPVARKLRLTFAGGRRQELKVEPPARELLIEAGQRDMLLPRSLDLRGETLTGTRREFCVLSYTTLVECGTEPTAQVVKLEFPG